MNTVLLIVLLGYVLISAAWTFYEILKLTGKSIGENERVKFYRSAVLEGLVFVVFVLLMVIFTDITMPELGITSISISLKHFNIWLTAVTFVINGAFLILFLYQMICYLVSETYRKQVKEQLEKQKAQGSRYVKILSDIMLPRTGREKRWFAAVSASVGIGEEIIYRGLLFYLLVNVFPELPVCLLPIIGGIPFGAAHSYQGFSGAFREGLMGILFGALYIASGSLLPGILLHFTADFAANFIFAPENEEDKQGPL
jgi:membrane protease YdiL (CAAX protease family)